MKILNALLLFAFICQSAYGQGGTRELSDRANLLFGLNQPLLASGFNIEGNLFYGRLAFDYSHGISLDFSNDLLTGEVADQGLAIHIPYSTGFGIGYRFNDWFNLRLEPKWHKFEVFYDGDSQTSANRLGSYTTFSLGLGAYIDWRPFKNNPGPIQGFMVSPSVRYWPRLSSSLNNDEFTYDNRNTSRTETHEAMEIGLSNTPWIINVSIGYSISLD